MVLSQGTDTAMPASEPGITAAPRKSEVHQDVEAGPESVDIERIEKVYA